MLVTKTNLTHTAAWVRWELIEAVQLSKNRDLILAPVLLQVNGVALCAVLHASRGDESEATAAGIEERHYEAIEEVWNAFVADSVDDRMFVKTLEGEVRRRRSRHIRRLLR